MKQTLEIDVPDGFEIERVKILDDCALVDFKKKQTKDFDYFVDQYLPVRDNSTSDEIIDWIEVTNVSKLNTYLKAKQFNLIPWEIKIGLFRFICESFNVKWTTLLRRYEPFGMAIRSAEAKELLESTVDKILPQEFIDDLFK